MKDYHVRGKLWSGFYVPQTDLYLLFLLCIGNVSTSKEKERSLCVPDFPEPSDIYWQYIDLLTFILLYVLPLLIITASYTTVACRLWRHNAIGDTTTAQHATQRRKRRRTLAMLLLVVGVFAVCWFPLNCYVVLLSSQAIHSSNALYFCFHWLAMSSTCYNPFIYCCLNPTFRHELRLLYDMCRRRQRVVGLEPELRPAAICTPRHRAAWPDNHESSRLRRDLPQPGQGSSQQSGSSQSHNLKETHVLFIARQVLAGRADLLSVEPIVAVSWLKNTHLPKLWWGKHPYLRLLNLRISSCPEDDRKSEQQRILAAREDEFCDGF